MVYPASLSLDNASCSLYSHPHSIQVENGIHPDGTPRYQCRSRGYTAPWQRTVYVTWLAHCAYLIPAAVAAFCNLSIGAHLFQTAKKQRHFEPTKSRNSSGETITLQRQNYSQTQQRTTDKKLIKSLKSTACLALCYIVCWTPHFTVTLHTVWTDNDSYRHTMPAPLRLLSKCLAWSSSCANPILYAIFHVSCRKIFYPITTSRNHRLKQKQPQKTRRNLFPGGLQRPLSGSGSGGCLICSGHSIKAPHEVDRLNVWAENVHTLARAEEGATVVNGIALGVGSESPLMEVIVIVDGIKLISPDKAVWL